MQFAFDWPPRFVGERGAVTRSLRRGYLPVVTTQWENGGLAFSSRAFACRLRDDVMVVFVRVALTNRAAAPQPVRHRQSLRHPDQHRPRRPVQSVEPAWRHRQPLRRSSHQLPPPDR